MQQWEWAITQNEGARSRYKLSKQKVLTGFIVAFVTDPLYSELAAKQKIWRSDILGTKCHELDIQQKIDTFLLQLMSDLKCFSWHSYWLKFSWKGHWLYLELLKKGGLSNRLGWNAKGISRFDHSCSPLSYFTAPRGTSAEHNKLNSVRLLPRLSSWLKRGILIVICATHLPLFSARLVLSTIKLTLSAL